MPLADSENSKNQNLNSRSSGPKKWLFVFTTIFFILAASGIALSLWYESNYDQKIYPGIKIGPLTLSGMTQDEATALLNKTKDTLLKDGVTFFYHEKKVIVPAEVIASDPDLSQTIISIDVPTAVKEAYGVGRKSTFFKNTIIKFQSALTTYTVPIHLTVNEKQVFDILNRGFRELERPGRDADIVIRGSNITTTQESEGQTFEYVRAVNQMQNNLLSLRNNPIELTLTISHPQITKNEAEAMIPQVRFILNTTTPRLTLDKRAWNISRTQMTDWLELEPAADNKNSPSLRFNRDKAMIYLKAIASEVDIEPVDAKFELMDAKVTQFQISHPGTRLNLESSLEKINKEFFLYGRNRIELIAEVTPPKVTTTDVNNLGIKDLLGTGVSNFAGSPKNRRLNIANGARLLNGTLIKPGEEFSLLKVLGPFDETNGYLPELVIKADRTIPEFGGGLCQIGTTTFRAAIHSGLPITERRNHSYRVVYYEPAGMDATIYDPAPDLKFINDTSAHILVTTEIQGDNLYFRFYGTDDGRIATVPDKARVYNVTEPGEVRYIETTELPPGEKKLVEKPHNGADAEFDYSVAYADGTIKKQTFKSHYVAWRETWLIGKSADSTSTSTEALPTENLTNSFN